jgi:nickel-dependent lactate racemase
MIYFGSGSENIVMGPEDLRNGINTALQKLGKREKVLVVPPDFTRFHSGAGELTSLIYKYYGDKLKDILPALGTHRAMTGSEIKKMYTGVPEDLFRVHDFRNDAVTLGTVPSDYISETTDGLLDYSWPAQVNKLIASGCHDLILSVGQVVPHEVMGMASYNKNLFIGTGGAEGINKSHFIGAVFGLERIMGKADNPVRQLLNYASAMFMKDMPVVYVHTVIGRDDQGKLVTRGLFIGDDEEVFKQAADLSLKVNFTVVRKPLKKVVVWLDPSEYRSTWLGNKSIYRTRMALADNGSLTILAPSLREFGEDKEIDRLIRKYGYRGTPSTLKAVKQNSDLLENLSTAAHLIHGSTEGRFKVTYCPGSLSKSEIESVGYRFAPFEDMARIYDPGKLKEGKNRMPDGEEIYFISNPATGLWASQERINA